MVDLYFHRGVEEEKELDVSLAAPEKPVVSLKDQQQDWEGDQANIVPSGPVPIADDWNPALPEGKMDWADHHPAPAVARGNDDWSAGGGNTQW